jgi:hypothetical protein
MEVNYFWVVGIVVAIILMLLYFRKNEKKYAKEAAEAWANDVTNPESPNYDPNHF